MKWGGDREWSGAALDELFRDNLSETVTSDQRQEWSGRICSTALWGKASQAEGTAGAMAKGPDSAQGLRDLEGGQWGWREGSGEGLIRAEVSEAHAPHRAWAFL